MKNNNLARNNASKGINPNRTVIVIALICVFLIVVGYVVYKKWFNNESENILSIAPVISNIISYKNNITGSGGCPSKHIPDDPGNVNLLNNIRDKTIDKNITNKQVFNVSNNIFTYDDAKAVCKANGAELADYEQVLESYKKGGEWCNYGWSKGQMALYPTQKGTWELLQEDPENANSCGEWGVNGGYFENPNTLFGANCYGVKPKPKNGEKEKQLAFSKNQKIMLDKINMYKNQLNEIKVMPFNKNLWSEKDKQ